MVGGEIFGLLDKEDDEGTWVLTRDGRDTGVVLVPKSAAVKMAVGDKLWWQGKRCYWTPVAMDVQDVQARRYAMKLVDWPIKKLSASMSVKDLFRGDLLSKQRMGGGISK